MFFSPKKGLSFVKEVFEVLVVWGLVVKGLEYLWKLVDIKSPELVWAYTVATGLASLHLMMYICFTRQMVYQTRLDEKAEYCAELERKILKKRQSSRK